MKNQEIRTEELFKKDELDLQKWISRIANAWYWFVGSIVLLVLGAWFYLHYTNPTFQATASVMIKDEKKAGDISDNSVLKELGIGSSKLVENEIEILNSYDLMEAVVRKLQLFVSYKSEGRLRDVPIFGNDVPFILEVLNPDSIIGGTQWKIHVEKNNLFIIAASGEKLQIDFGKVYEKANIRFNILPNDKWREIYKKDTISDASYSVSIVPISSAAVRYNKQLSVDPVSKQASVVNLSMVDPHEEKARLILETLIDIYNHQGLEDKNKVTANTIDFLNERLKAVIVDLENVEGKVQKFKSQNQITDLSVDAQQYMNSASQIDFQKAQSQTKLNLVSALEREILVNQKSPGLVPSTFGLGETSLASLIEKHNSLILEKERIEKDKEFGPLNPLLISLNQQVLEVRSKLLSNVRNLKEAYQIELNDIARKDEQLKRVIRNMPHFEQKMLEIQRSRNVQEQLYSFLLQKREEAAVTLASNIPDSRTIVKARSLGSISPKSRLIWTGAIALGFLLPLIVMIIGDLINNRVGDVSEIEEKTDIPLLGIVSHIKKIKSSLVLTENSRSLVAEQIRSLRTAIGFTGKGTAVNKILITSFQPGDGKSFISINLAASFALLGKKSIILELDLRKPHVAKYLGVNAKKGITSFLAGKAEIEDILVEIPGYDGNLFMLAAGFIPPNPTELISTTRMTEMMSELEKRFDIIIIDTPPFSLVTDAVLLQKHVDITIAVLRQGYTLKDVYGELNQRLIQNPEHPFYIILNGVGWRKRYQSGYQYGKYSSYGYTQGYFEEENS